MLRSLVLIFMLSVGVRSQVRRGFVLKFSRCHFKMTVASADGSIKSRCLDDDDVWMTLMSG